MCIRDRTGGPAPAGIAQSPIRNHAYDCRTEVMSQLLDSVRIALQAIWANKLRSFMTVLGNIVAVASIVTVVSLIQGLNATVSDLIVSSGLLRVRSSSSSERTIPR